VQSQNIDIEITRYSLAVITVRGPQAIAPFDPSYTGDPR
jgi:hypothetical protein